MWVTVFFGLCTFYVHERGQKKTFRWKDSLSSLLSTASIRQDGRKSRKLFAVPNKRTKPLLSDYKLKKQILLRF